VSDSLVELSGEDYGLHAVGGIEDGDVSALRIRQSVGLHAFSDMAGKSGKAMPMRETQNPYRSGRKSGSLLVSVCLLDRRLLLALSVVHQVLRCLSRR
jgi:hypothetical protein